MTELSDNYQQHLEFLGYETETDFLEDNPSDFIMKLTHSTLWNMSIYKNSGAIYFNAWITLENKCFDYEIANTANDNRMWLKTTLDTDGDVRFRLYAFAEYERQQFGELMTIFDRGVTETLRLFSGDE